MMIKTSVLKALVYIFNFVIFICGAVILGLGIWSVVGQEGLPRLLDNVMLSGVYILLASGVVTMLLSFLGCYGCGKESKPAIVVYSTFGLVVITLETIGCIILYVFYINAANRLGESYKNEYGVSARVTEIWQDAQQLGECCGLKGYQDWEDSVYFNETGMYPLSCCVPSPSNSSTPLDRIQCQAGQDGFIYKEGCEYVLQKYYYGVGGTTIAVVILELFSVIFIVWYYQHIP